MKKLIILICLLAIAVPAHAVIYVFDRDGKCLEKNSTIPPPSKKEFQANHGKNIVIKIYDKDPLPKVDRQDITLKGNKLESIARMVAWLHVKMGASDAPTDGSKPLSLEFSFREGNDPKDKLMGFSGAYYVVLRGVSGQVYDIRMGTFKDGTMSVEYSGNGPGIVQISEADLQPVTLEQNTYKVKLANPVKMKFYGSF